MNFKSPEKVDIMAIGGSFFWGWMIKNEDTFLEILANDMEVKVANFALPSYGTLQSFQLLERNIDLNPKIIIYGFWLGHVRRNLCPFAPAICPFPRYVSYIDFDNQNNPYIHPPKGKYSKAFTKNFYEEVIHNPSIFGNIFWGAKLSFFKLIGKTNCSYLNEDIYRKKGMKFLVNEMHNVAKKINATFIVMYLPALGRGQASQPPQELLQSLDKDIIFIDLSNKVNQYYKDPMSPSLQLKNDGHPNELAHKMMANEIKKVLKRKKLF